jgi:hypothetical protein
MIFEQEGAESAEKRRKISLSSLRSPVQKFLFRVLLLHQSGVIHGLLLWKLSPEGGADEESFNP